MDILTMNELLHLTRSELCGLETRAEVAVRQLPEASDERANALINLRNIRRVLAWRDAAPG